MTRDRILACWDLVGRLAFLVVLCFCAEMLVYVVQMFVALAVGEENFGSTGIIASIWRWLAWAPATIYAAAVLICLPLPRIRRDTRWSAGGHMRVPPHRTWTSPALRSPPLPQHGGARAVIPPG